jgi:hypothetical protein
LSGEPRQPLAWTGRSSGIFFCVAPNQGGNVCFIVLEPIVIDKQGRPQATCQQCVTDFGRRTSAGCSSNLAAGRSTGLGRTKIGQMSPEAVDPLRSERKVIRCLLWTNRPDRRPDLRWIFQRRRPYNCQRSLLAARHATPRKACSYTRVTSYCAAMGHAPGWCCGASGRFPPRVKRS